LFPVVYFLNFCVVAEVFFSVIDLRHWNCTM